jgi:hypothetical protein
MTILIGEYEGPKTIQPREWVWQRTAAGLLGVGTTRLNGIRQARRIQAIKLDGHWLYSLASLRAYAAEQGRKLVGE